MVAMIALSLKKPTRIPFAKPAAIAQRDRHQHGRAAAARCRRAGKWVEMTTASETPPATERSNPPCWTTSNCPSPTMAMTAANGRLPAKRARRQAGRREHETGADQRDRRNHDRHKPLRQRERKNAPPLEQVARSVDGFIHQAVLRRRSKPAPRAFVASTAGRELTRSPTSP